MSKLNRLQHEVLEAFFRREQRFFLTGGAALAGFHLKHRETRDLDLFVTTDALADGVALLHEIARELRASVEPLQTSPDFRRFILTQAQETIVVDLVRERAHQMFPEKPTIGLIRVDPPQEILANKLCTLLSRAEIRDLVDVRALEHAGHRVEDALAGAALKDAGLTAAQLAWVLSQITIGEDANPPGGVTAQQLRGYLENLIERLARLAYPKGDLP